jgi:hypothetical protein
MLGTDKKRKLRGITHAITSKAQMRTLKAASDRHTKTMGRAATIRDTAVGRNAVRVGAVALGASALYYAGVKTYRMKKRQAQERPQFSSYDVYPQLSHSAARQQVHNRPVYYDDRDVGGGPPRVEDMNMIREELIEMMSIGALAKRSKSNVVGKYREIGGIKGMPRTSKRNMARTFTSLDTKRKKRNKKRIASFDRAAKAATKGKYRKTYSSAIDRADRRGKKIHLGIGAGLAATGSPVAGAAIGASGLIPYHRKSIKAMERHVQGVKAVKKQIHKEKKRADSAKYFSKEYVPAWNKGHEKSPVVKGYRKMAKKIKRMGEEERNQLVDMVFEALLRG